MLRRQLVRCGAATSSGASVAATRQWPHAALALPSRHIATQSKAPHHRVVVALSTPEGVGTLQVCGVACSARQMTW